jgi:hypothetical protein
MRKFAIGVLVTATLAQPALSLAGDNSAASGKTPTSYVPHPHTNQHVYGAPIGPAIMGHGKTIHHQHTPKKPSSIS